MIKRRLGALARHRQGSIGVISALTLPILIAIIGLVAEFGNALVHQTEDQRIADAAAFAAATAYSANSSNSYTSAADGVAAMNRLSASNVTVALVNSPSGDGNQAIQVTISTQTTLLLAQALKVMPSVSSNVPTQLTVNANAYAEIQGGVPGCIIALSGAGTGVTANGGTSTTTNSCAVNSNASVAVSGGATITTTKVTWDTTAPTISGGASISAPAGKTLTTTQAVTSDPLAGASGVTTATSRLSTVTALTNPTAPTVTGGTACVVTSTGCAGAPSACLPFNTSTHTFTCTGNGPFVWGPLSNGGGVSYTINMTGASPEMDVNGSFTGASGGPVTITSANPVIYKITKGIIVSGGETVTFAAGTLNIGAVSTASCNGSNTYSICDSSTLTINGPSTFVLTGGIYNSGGSKLTLGSGTTNSFNVGKAADGNSFVAGGGATTIFGDATGAGDLFQMAGNFNISSGGGSCTQVSAAAEHDIDGFFATAGGVSLGAGVYTVDGYIGLGNNGGGDVTCWGSTLGMSAVGVTFVTGAASTMSSSPCAGDAFCIAAGYGHVTITAPTSGTTANLAVIGPTGGSTAGAGFGSGATNTRISGAFYFPNGPITLSGAAAVGDNTTGDCLMLIGSQISLTGGSAMGSTCTGIGGSASGGGVVLVR